MNAESAGSQLAELLGGLQPRAQQPPSARVLDAWITQMQERLGDEASGGRLGWLIASSVAIAAMQRAIDAEGRQLFLLKGGTLLQHRLHVTARATKDVDGLIRGDMNAFFAVLEEVLGDPWGPLTLRRGEVEIIDVPTKRIKPRRFDLYLELRGVTWRRVQFEVSPDEAGIGEEDEPVQSLPLSGFGLPNPDAMVGIAIKFQIAQKIHAVTDPHEPPRRINDRPRDVVDLLLLRDLIAATGDPGLDEVCDAAIAVFEARAAEAVLLGFPERHWPPVVRTHDHWREDFARAAGSAGLAISLHQAVDDVNAWIDRIAKTGQGIS